MNNKKSLIYSLIAVLLIVTIVAGGTFAYFQWTSGTSDRSNVNVTIEAGQITMHIEPETTVMTNLRPTNSCNNAVSYGDALMKIENKTGAMAIPSFKLSVKVTKNGTGNLTSDDLSHIHYAVVPVETTSTGGKGDEAADCANPVSFTVSGNDLYFDGITEGSATGTFATVSTAGEWSDLPSTENTYLPRQFDTQSVTPYGVTFLGKPHATSYQWFRVYVWIDEGYTFTNTGSDITDPLQNAKIEVTWSTNSMLEQVSSIISGGDAVVAKEAGYYENGTRIYTWDELVSSEKIYLDETEKTIGLFNDVSMIGELVIPDEINTIYGNAFNNTSIKKITFGAKSQLTSIEEYAFANSKLDSIAIPDTVTTIGVGAFQLSLLKEISFGKNSQLNMIGEYAFDRSLITSIKIPDTVTTIGAYALGNYSDGKSTISSITFGANSQLISIGTAAFANTSITNFELPVSVKNIGNYIFEGSTLTELKYGGTKSQWNSISLHSDWANYSNITKIICSDGTINL